MLYFLVMGAIALSVLFSVAWLAIKVTRLVRPRRAPANRSRRARPGSSRSKSQTTKRSKPQAPGRLARLLAPLSPLRGAAPLCLVAWTTYGALRLAHHGMLASPRTLPDTFDNLISVVGGVALALLVATLVGLLGHWQYRRQ
ncbi:hypothetical protein [Bisbaumannia pacifica]|uniref:Uncharacterized protein n=1 Tax=Bisbaumannia pacifica TaxID=77098 RepID=A0ABD4L4R5_9GAMM|nr:hypothetical protein [Halomonas pacifica]MBH8580582.1 hypothetical protein [Halomonas pacifica]